MAPSVRARARAALLIALAPLAAVAGDGDARPPAFGEELEVVGQRRPGAVGDETAAATVVDAHRFEGEARSVAELIATAPGVAVSQYGGLGQLTTVSLRGSSAAEVQVFLDGLPLNTAAGGGVDLARIPRAWIERIEVVRGAEGAVYGAGTLGGAVNIVTRRAVAGAWSAEATAGSFRTFAGSADGAVGGERWGLLGAVAVEDTSGRFGYLFDDQPALAGNPLQPLERTHDAAFTAGGLAKLWAAVGEGRLDAVLQLSGGTRDLPGSPYQLTPNDGQRDARAGAVVHLAEQLAEGLDLVLGAAGRDDRLTVWLEHFPTARQRDLAGEASAELRWTSGPSVLALRAAGGGERLEVEGAPTRGWAEGSLSASDQLQLLAGRLRVAPAVRVDAMGPFRGLSAKVGAALRVAGPLSVRASAGRSFRAPSFAELYLRQGLLDPNPDLAPETSWSADAGVALDGRLGLASATAFTQQYRDLIVYEAASFRRFKPLNDGKAAANGLELEAASAPLGPAALALSGAYTFLATETLRGSAAQLGKDLPHRARHRLYARLAGERGPVAAHAEAQWISAQFQDLANSPALRVPPVLAFGAGASVRLIHRPETRLALEVRNLADDRTLQDGFGNPLPGRTVMITLRVSGGKDAP